MEPDYGLRIGQTGMLKIAPMGAYDMGRGDFALTCLVHTIDAGPLITRGFDAGPASLGWSLEVKEDGRIRLTTTDVSGRVSCETQEPTSALNGAWHGIAAVREAGEVKIYYDGEVVPSTQVGPVLVSPREPMTASPGHVLIGSIDAARNDDQFSGIIEDVSVWSRALDTQDIWRTMRNQVRPDEPGLIGFWEMNNNLEDSSPYANTAVAEGQIDFVPVCHCVWTRGENNYEYLAFDVNPWAYGDAAHNGEVATRTQTIKVEPGTSVLYGGAIDKSKQGGTFPEGAEIKLFTPDGTQLNTETDTETQFIHMEGDAVSAFNICNPDPGEWRVEVICPCDLSLHLNIQTAPNENVPATIEMALREVYDDIPQTYARYLADDPQALSAFRVHWGKVLIWAGVAVAAVCLAVVIVALAAAVATGGAVIASSTLFLAIKVGLAAAAIAGVGLATIIFTVEGATKSAIEMGISPPQIGGSAPANLRLILDGRTFMPTLRDLFLAVEANSYDAAGKTIPDNVEFASLAKRTAQANRDVYVLMWDYSSIQHIIETNDYLKYYFRNWWNSDDARRNARTRKALKDVDNLEVALEPYHPYHKYVSTASQHQKIAIFSINGEKCALVGGFNILPSYWDDEDHPMYDHSNYHSWHDAAVLLTGKAVDLVEKEFDRRWMSTYPDAKVASQGTYAKVSFWDIKHDTCLDEPGTCGTSRKSTIPYKDPRLGGSNVSADVLVTNTEYIEPVLQPRQKLIEKIAGATDFIYFENFTFSDAGLVAALVEKMQIGMPHGLKVIFVTPHPTKGSDHYIQQYNYYNTHAAFVALAMSTRQWRTAKLKNGITIDHDSITSFDVVVDPDRPIDEAQLAVAYPGTVTELISVNQVIEVDMIEGHGLFFSSPARSINGLDPSEERFQLIGQNTNFRSIYVHSKVAIIDDEYAMIGSANFNRRSMCMDGECSIGVDTPAVAKDIREKLFRHWNMSDVESWQDMMYEFAKSTTDGLGILPLSLTSLSGFPAPPWYMTYMAAIVDPSDKFGLTLDQPPLSLNDTKWDE